VACHHDLDDGKTHGGAARVAAGGEEGVKDIVSRLASDIGSPSLLTVILTGLSSATASSRTLFAL
jgi:hypothetical protein